jgi:riboflavin synthase
VFTGIIEEIGGLVGISPRGNALSLTIKATKVISDLKEGDSIAVNGACLTVVAWEKDIFIVEVSPETLARSNLGKLRIGERINLERALKLGDRLGGHQVTGHIDGVGRIVALEREGEFLFITVQAPPEVMKYVVVKGSIALDGVSLTIAACWGDRFQISVIPYTAKVTTIGQKSMGSEVNLEADLVGKYIERFMSARGGQLKDQARAIDHEFLAEHGFI